MANTKLTFLGNPESELQEHALQCFSNTRNEIYIEIEMPNWETSFICLDRETAIKFHRELKKQISYLSKEDE